MSQKTDRHIIYVPREKYCKISNGARVHAYWPRFTHSSLPLSNYIHAVANSMQTVYLLVCSANSAISVFLVHANLFINAASLYIIVIIIGITAKANSCALVD